MKVEIPLNRLSCIFYGHIGYLLNFGKRMSTLSKLSSFTKGRACVFLKKSSNIVTLVSSWSSSTADYCIRVKNESCMSDVSLQVGVGFICKGLSDLA